MAGMGELQSAAYYGRLDKIVSLLTTGTGSCSDKTRALHIAVERNYRDIAMVLITHGTKPDCYDFHTSIEKGFISVVRAIIDTGFNVHCCHDISLYQAATYGCSEMVELLLAAGVNFRARENMALRRALYDEKSEIVKCLALKYTTKELEDIQEKLRSPLLAEVIDLRRPRGLHTKAALREPRHITFE